MGALPLDEFGAPELDINFASKEATIALDRGHDQAAIGPRSRGDRASIVAFSLAVFNWNRAPRSWHLIHDERSMIAADVSFLCVVKTQRR